MQERLALARPASGVAALAVALDLPDMSAHRFPAPDLPRILFGHAAA